MPLRVGLVAAWFGAALPAGACGAYGDRAPHGVLSGGGDGGDTSGAGETSGTGMGPSGTGGSGPAETGTSGAGSSTGAAGTSFGSMGPGTGGSAGLTGGAGGGPSFGDSVFGSVTEMFEYVNSQRQGYAAHDRYRGFPFAGAYHPTVTWPLAMQWSDEAAGVAQAEADAVASGAVPSGMATFAKPGVEPIFVAGVDTEGYMVSGPERPGMFATDTCTLCNSNPFMRMAVFYHDPGGKGRC